MTELMIETPDILCWSKTFIYRTDNFIYHNNAFHRFHFVEAAQMPLKRIETHLKSIITEKV